jgi:hypothetical protein
LNLVTNDVCEFVEVILVELTVNLHHIGDEEIIHAHDLTASSTREHLLDDRARDFDQTSNSDDAQLSPFDCFVNRPRRGFEDFSHFGDVEHDPVAPLSREDLPVRKRCCAHDV